MARPIRTLQEGAQRIGEGDLDQKIDIRTGDELEALAGQFNRMTAQLRESYAGLERKVDERTSELANSLEQQTAISEILRVISSSPTDVQPVLKAVAERAAQLCDAPFARIMLVDGDRSCRRPSTATALERRGIARATPVPCDRTSITGRAAVDGATVHHRRRRCRSLDTEFPRRRENMLRVRAAAPCSRVPLMREGGAYGGDLPVPPRARPFSPDQIALVETFARQAAIAIDNVRLFNETKEALEQQTAISEILRVISGSPTDVQPVLRHRSRERARALCDAAR